MPRKKTYKKNKKPVIRHQLPGGFWSQVWAVVLIAISIVFIVSWFGFGGPILESFFKLTMGIVGYSLYTIPLFFIYTAVLIFRAEDNKIPFVIKFAVVLEIILFSGLFGLIKSGNSQYGGSVGTFIDNAFLELVNSGVAAFIYVLIIFLTTLFIFSISPKTFLNDMFNLFKTDKNKEKDTEALRRKEPVLASNNESTIAKKPNDFKLNASVPMLDHSQIQNDKKDASSKSSQSGVEDQQALVTVSDPNWKTPSLDLLEKKQSPADAGDVKQNAQIIHDTLAEFGIEVEMEGANIGPKVTQYTLHPPSGVKLTKITQLETNLALNLAASSLRIEAPIPGQRAVGIEVPNRKAADVRLYSILDSKQWKNTREPLSFAIGKDIAGEPVVGELNKMPHLLIAGQTGSGKSVMINTLLTSLLYRNSPSEMKLILVDPKRVEMVPYEGIPHLLTPVITEPDKTISALKWAVNEMERRYRLLADEKMRDIKGYNNKMNSRAKKIEVSDDDNNIKSVEQTEGAMPYIIIVIDELADLMMMAPRDVEALIVRIAQKARAVGIHLVLATQRPSVNVITGIIKANIPARIAFTVASQIDSRTILDQIGAEKLLGQGDMLIKTASMSKPKRIQGAWVMDEEVIKIANDLCLQSAPQYNDDIISQPVQMNGKGGVVMDFDSSNTGGDDLFKDAVRVVVESGKASTSLLQRRLRVGYARAARIIEEMEEQGIVGPQDGARPREVLIDSLDDVSSSSND
jgi:S-DNA-T family DNA segregation ATPase FtsK/SpoIIIE